MLDSHPLGDTQIPQVWRRLLTFAPVDILLSSPSITIIERLKLMSKPNRSFFTGKRSWSAIKDRVLGSYMPPYLSKVKQLGRPILLVDCFAGRGKFDDGKPGSPLIMCQMVEKYAQGLGRCVFVNSVKGDHKALEKTLDAFIQKKVAYPVYGNSQSLLIEIQRRRRISPFSCTLIRLVLKVVNFAR